MLQLPADAIRSIERHGEETYPYECCGALLGKDDVVTSVFGLPNTTAEGPRRRFLVGPGDYRAAEAQARDVGADLLGFYHSHPDHPARPSQFDLDHAWPTFAYVIVSIVEGRAADMTVWRLSDDRSRFDADSLATVECA